MSEPWYKRNARDFYEGTRRLTLEQRGAYTDLIDLIYIHDGEVPDDQDWLAHALHISRRKWRTIRTALIEAGKIASVDGKITNSRAEIELSERRRRREINRENASGPRRFDAGSEPVQSGTSAEPASNCTKKLNENNENEKQVPTDVDIDKDKLSKATDLKVVEPRENPPPDEKPKVPEEAIDRLCNLSGYFPTRSWVEHRLAEEIASVGEPRVMAALDDLEVAKGTGRLRCDAVKALRGFVAKAKPKGGAQASSPIVTDPDRIAQIAEKARAKRLAERGVTMGAIADAG
jgi:uncharacterized protein YdaU (DUF1376 family)